MATVQQAGQEVLTPSNYNPVTLILMASRKTDLNVQYPRKAVKAHCGHGLVMKYGDMELDQQ